MNWQIDVADEQAFDELLKNSADQVFEQVLYHVSETVAVNISGNAAL